MQLQVRTLLNKLHPLKHHVYASTALIDRPKGPEIHVTIVPRKNSLARCADCLRPGSTYDHQLERTWRFVPLWALAVILVYVPRRVSCGNCNRVVIEHMSWSCGKSDVAEVYMSFLATWASRLSWAETARIFGVSWQCVRSSIARVVTYGLEHRNLDGISAIGVDEICYRVGQKFITLVYQVDAGSRRLLWICDTRREKAFTAFFTWFGEERSAALEVVCSDMWAPYLKVIRLKAGGALNVLDKFHIVKHLNEGVDETRRRDAAELRKQGEDVTLKHSRWCLLKRPANLTANQRGRLASLLKLNLRTARAYILKEEFNHFWTYKF